MKILNILNELHMTPKAFAQTASVIGDNVLVGFELEMCYPITTDVQKTTETMNIKDIDSFDEFTQWFQIKTYDYRAIDRNFRTWLEGIRDEFVKDHYEEFIDGELAEDDPRQAEKEAKDSASDHWKNEIEGEYTLDQFVDDEYNSSYKDFIDAFGLSPNHGWENEYRGDFYLEPVPESLNESIRQKIFEYLTDQFGPGVIREVVYDSSIEVPSNDYVETEVITEPLPLTDGLDVLQSLTKWMIRKRCVTNDTTGLHINISIKGAPPVDWLKLALIVGQTYVLSLFDRQRNTYTIPNLNDAEFYLRTGGMSNVYQDIYLKKDPIQEVITSISDTLAREKFRFFNITKYSDGYVEFRAAGGDGYEHNFAQIKLQTLRFVRSLYIATQPELYKQEYYKKLYQLLNKTAAKRESPTLNRGQRTDINSTIKFTLRSFFRRIMEYRTPTDRLTLYNAEIPLEDGITPDNIKKFYMLLARPLVKALLSTENTFTLSINEKAVFKHINKIVNFNSFIASIPWTMLEISPNELVRLKKFFANQGIR